VEHLWGEGEGEGTGAVVSACMQEWSPSAWTPW
jgi:hypothetical protein